MSIEIKVTENGKDIAHYTNIKEKKFKTGKQGYYCGGILVINGKAHRANLLFIEAGA